MDKKVLLWAKNEDLSSAVQIGVQEGGLYRVSEDSTHAVDPCELCHRRFEHLHCTALPGLQKIVSRGVIFHEKAMFQTQDLSKEDEVPPLEFPVSETQREEEEFEDQISEMC